MAPKSDPNTYQAPAHRYTPVEAAAAVTTAFAERSADSLLAHLHSFELGFADQYEWPWIRWQRLGEDDPAYMDALPTALPPRFSNSNPPTVHKILLSALDMRLKHPRDDSGAVARSALFAEDFGLIKETATLGPSLQLELVLTSRHNRNWAALEQLALRLLKQETLSPYISFEGVIRRLLLDILKKL